MKEPLSGDALLHYRFTRRKKEPAIAAGIGLRQDPAAAS
jgi:hypothetical protein